MYKLLTTAQLIRVTQIPRGTIYHWLSNGLLTPAEVRTDRGPNDSSLHDMAVAVWAMFLDELFKTSGKSKGQVAAEVLLRANPNFSGMDQGGKIPFEKPRSLYDSSELIDFLRLNGFDFVALSLAGILETDKPSKRGRFDQIRILFPREALDLLTTNIGPIPKHLGPSRIIRSSHLISFQHLSSFINSQIKRL